MSERPDDVTAFTDALARIPPHPGLLDRDALLFAAGRASARRSARWPATVAALTVLSSALSVMLVMRPPTIVEVERIVYVPTPVPRDEPGTEPAVAPEDLRAPSQTPASPGDGSLALVEGLRLRNRVLHDGVGALPQTSWALPSFSPSPSPSPDDVPDLLSLRLNARHPDGERSQ